MQTLAQFVWLINKSQKSPTFAGLQINLRHAHLVRLALRYFAMH